jgi:hypothetical protein
MKKHLEELGKARILAAEAQEQFSIVLLEWIRRKLRRLVMRCKGYPVTPWD